MTDRGRGWRMFAGITLFVAALMRVFDAIWAFRSRGDLPDVLEDALLGDNLKTYGWMWLITAAVLAVAGFLVINRSETGRWVGVVAAGLLTLGAATWLPYYPIWSITYIGLGTLVIYALVAHGGHADRYDPEYSGLTEAQAGREV